MNFCIYCRADISERSKTATQCLDCSRSENTKEHKHRVGRLKDLCRKVTNYAVQIGYIQPWAGKQCVECGKAAECYDHRDYRNPMWVDPVCMRCNCVRGRGYPPTMRG